MTLDSFESTLDFTSGALPSLALMGYNESGMLGEGWHDIEYDQRNNIPYRATHQTAEIRLGKVSPPDWALTDFSGAPPISTAGSNEPQSLGILLSGSPSLLGRPLRGTITVYSLGGADESEFEIGMKIAAIPVQLAWDSWIIRRIPLGSDSNDKILRVVFSIDEVVTPDRVLHNGDSRGLGWYVSAVWRGNDSQRSSRMNIG